MGLIDYLLDVDKRSIQNRRRAEYAVELEQQTAADQRQAVGLAQALAGVGKGPQAPVQQPDGRFKTPMDPDAAAAVRLMQNPGSRGIGNQLATNVMDPAWQQQQQNAQDQGYATRQGMDMAASEEARRNQAFPGQMTIQGQTIAGNNLSQRLTRQQLQAGNLALQNAMLPPAPPTEAEAFKAETGLDLPKDFMVVRNPYTKVNQAVPMPNTSLYNAAADEIAKQQAAVTSLTQFLFTMDQAGASGTEYIGPLAKELKKRRYDVMAALRLSGNLGTPTGGEQKMVDDLLPDPTNEWRNMYGAEVNVLTGGLGSEYFKRNITAPYEAMRSDAEAKLKALQERYHYIPVTPGVVAGR